MIKITLISQINVIVVVELSIYVSVRLQQGTVTSLVEENGTVKGIRYKKTKEDKEITLRAPLTVVCDGCCSNLRRSLCTSKVIPGFYLSHFIH